MSHVISMRYFRVKLDVTRIYDNSLLQGLCRCFTAIVAWLKQHPKVVSWLCGKSLRFWLMWFGPSWYSWYHGSKGGEGPSPRPISNDLRIAPATTQIPWVQLVPGTRRERVWKVVGTTKQGIPGSNTRWRVNKKQLKKVKQGENTWTYWINN